MARTSREPKLASTRMKEKQLWSMLLREWDVSIGTVLLRIVWLAIVGWALIGLVSLVGGCDDPKDRDPSGQNTKTVDEWPFSRTK